ncbi:MAG: nitroreductase family deazaflavin-dependent oxidoreductase [Deltaproteobacteria bacterium]|jgi:deazaflavin-dependent oxidoreductase (nitroreductase family)|nr:nitroreductase family deazaflavin-dependent oxidoreductase [Deltaproteobacteria bacterium]
MADTAQNVRTNATFVRWFSRFHVWLYRRTGGRVLGQVMNAPILLLTTTGRKTGVARTTPLIFLRDGSELAVVASNGGADRTPAWWLNLQQQGVGEVQIGPRRTSVTARQASAAEQARLWPLLNGIYPEYESYQKKTTRPIPVVLLTPAE